MDTFFRHRITFIAFAFIVFFPGQVFSESPGICLSEDVIPVLRTMAELEMSDTAVGGMFDPNDLEAKGNCDSVSISMSGAVKIADAVMAGNCDMNVTFSPMIKALAELSDTTIDVCSEALQAKSIPTANSPYITAVQGSERLVIKLHGYPLAEAPQLHVFDSRGKKIWSARQGIRVGDNIHFFWKNSADIYGLYYIEVIGNGFSSNFRALLSPK